MLAASVPKERQKEAEAELEKFDAFWTSSQMTEEFQNSFIEISNLMLRKNMRFFPHFSAFFKAFDAFINSDLSEYDKAWLRILQYHVNNDLSDFHNVMGNYVNIFNDNILFKSGSSKWTAYGAVESMGMEKEPYIEYSDIDLVGAGSRDSVEILGTSGRYYPASTRWVGKGGKINWLRAGLPEEKVMATFEDYALDTRQPKVKIQNATLYYPELLGQPILGTLEDKAGLETDESKVTFPRFRSNDDNLTVRNIYDNVDYIGGFELRGASIEGDANAEQLARINIRKGNRVVASIAAIHFLFKEETTPAPTSTSRPTPPASTPSTTPPPIFTTMKPIRNCSSPARNTGSAEALSSTAITKWTSPWRPSPGI